MSDDKLVIQNLVKSYGAVTAVDNINLSIASGKLFSLLGPSGCGKTTTLRMIAGLEMPDDGKIIVDDTVLSDRKRAALPEKRNMGMVFQSYAVWPHMTVWDNVAYGLKIKKIAKNQIEAKVKENLDLVGLYQYRERFPTQLSGGQQQRVALARALATEPSILLLDEPLCNLDAKLRENMRFEIRELQKRLGITAVYVTHSQEEALAVSDEIVIMRSGKILQQGTPETVYSKPNCSFVADFIGLINELNATVVSADSNKTVVLLANGHHIVAASSDSVWREGEACKVLIRPENILFFSSDRTGTYNTIEAQIENVSYSGSIVNYFLHFSGLEASFRMQCTPPVLFSEGQKATCGFTPESCILVKE